VTITPDTGVGPDATVRIDVEAGTARIVELVVRPQETAARPSRRNAAGDGQLSASTLDLILRAVQPAVVAVGAMGEGTAATEAPAAAPEGRPARGRATKRQRPGRAARAAA